MKSSKVLPPITRYTNLSTSMFPWYIPGITRRKTYSAETPVIHTFVFLSWAPLPVSGSTQKHISGIFCHNNGNNNLSLPSGFQHHPINNLLNLLSPSSYNVGNTCLSIITRGTPYLARPLNQLSQTSSCSNSTLDPPHIPRYCKHC